jgi:Zn2+/Cd2+-exporting ATPase
MHEPTPAWMLTLVDFLQLQQNVEAVLVDPEHRKISLATWSVANAEQLQAQLESVLETVDADQTRLTDFPDKLGNLRLERDGAGILISKPSCPTAPRLWQWRKFNWPEPDDAGHANEWKMLAKQAAICGAALLLGWLWDNYGCQPRWVAYLCYGLAMLAGGWDAAIDAWEELKARRLDVHFLMLAVAAGAAAIGAWTEGALLLFLFSASGAMEHFAEHRTHQEISALSKATPKTATVLLPDGKLHTRAVGLLAPGDVIEIKPDSVFPADGTVLHGQTSVDEANLTGESQPVDKKVGDPIYSGTLNQWGLVQVRLTKAAKESTVQNIMRLIYDARQQRSPSQRITDRFGTGYTLGLLGLTSVAFFLWWLVGGLPAWQSTTETKSAFYRAMALLVVASPCALVLSIPSAILAAIARGAKLGVLFRSGAAIEKLAEVDTVALDKTGTLTTGQMRLEAVESFPPGNEALVLQIAYTLEKNSNHPIARAITVAGDLQGLNALGVSDFVSLPGQGLKATVAGQRIVLGRRELIAQGNLAPWLEALPTEPLAATEVWVLGQQFLGRILLLDQLRQESAPVIAELARQGIPSIMLTGDRRNAATEVAAKLGISQVQAGLTPEQKLATIQQLSKDGKRVAMVGDGVNDAPSLAAAHVAVAMGGRGSDAALEQADLALMNDRIDKLLTARALSLQARSIIRQNLLISLGTVLLMVATALTTAIPLTLGVLAHEGSTFLVCLNSLRLLFWQERSSVY